MMMTLILKGIEKKIVSQFQRAFVEPAVNPEYAEDSVDAVFQGFGDKLLLQKLLQSPKTTQGDEGQVRGIHRVSLVNLVIAAAYEGDKQ